MLHFLIGLFVGANMGLFLYASIFLAKEADESMEKDEEVNSE